MGLRTEVQIDKTPELLEGDENFSVFSNEDREVAFILDPKDYVLRAAEKCPQTGSQIGGMIAEVDLSDIVSTIASGLISINNGQEDLLEE